MTRSPNRHRPLDVSDVAAQPRRTDEIPVSNTGSVPLGRFRGFDPGQPHSCGVTSNASTACIKPFAPEWL
jgi:hypothetical protein